MTGKYATSTSVSVEKSRAEIESVLRRYGCDEFAYSTKPGEAMLGFCLTSSKSAGGLRLRIAMRLPLPPMKDFEFRPWRSGRKRCTPEEQARNWEQACRSSWRAMLLVIKAKLEAVSCGISTIEREFMADILLPQGGTIGDSVLEQLPTVGGGRLLLPGAVS